MQTTTQSARPRHPHEHPLPPPVTTEAPRQVSYPEYSAEFFDGEHYVMKGASPVTVRELLRPSFRNWFRSRYPYMYATFRCVKASGAGA